MPDFLKVLFALACLVTLAACGSGDTPEAAARQYAESIYAGKPDKVFAMLHIPKDKEAGVEDVARGKIKNMVAKEVERAQAHGGVKEIATAPAEVKPGDNGEARATVRLTVTFKNAEAKPQISNVRLIKTGGQWKIHL